MRSNLKNLTEEQRINLIINGQVQLKDIDVGKGIRKSGKNSYQDVTGHFCQLDWALHKEDPSSCESIILSFVIIVLFTVICSPQIINFLLIYSSVLKIIMQIQCFEI